MQRGDLYDSKGALGAEQLRGQQLRGQQEGATERGRVRASLKSRERPVYLGPKTNESMLSTLGWTVIPKMVLTASSNAVHIWGSLCLPELSWMPTPGVTPAGRARSLGSGGSFMSCGR
jgi:hypothetical protein